MKANLATNLGYIYFEAQRKLNANNVEEFVFPIDEFDSEFNAELVYEMVKIVNENHKLTPEINK